MKTKNKALLLSMCAVLLVVASVLGTMAYLTSTETVTNTFAVGKVAITLDEAPVGADGKKIEGDRVDENEYHLIPGGTYDKDPTVHVEANSENSYIFVKVENGLADVEGTNTIAAQIVGKGWIALDGVDGVYYKTYTKSETVIDLVVFDTVTISDSATNDSLADVKDAKITVTAYAIQSAGMVNAADAWAKLTQAYTPAA